MEIQVMAEKLVHWIQFKGEQAGTKGLVLGVSGGLDSAVVAGLAARAFPGSTLGVIMPCHSLVEDVEHARLVVERFGIEARYIDLSAVYDCLIQVLTTGCSSPHSLAAANIKPRLRMTTLYYLAQERGYLVVGTSNRTEITIGYFTKHADSGVDLWPIGGLVKRQVQELARHLGVPEVIITKAPSAGLWTGQTDEGEIGLSYPEMDKYILSGQGPDRVRQRVEALHQKSEHKRHLPPIPEV